MKILVLILLLSLPAMAQVKEDSKPKNEQETNPEESSPLKDAFFAPQELKQKEALEKEDNLNLVRHQPLYFAYGDPASKVQMSFKYNIVTDIPIYFAYTQIMF